MKCIWCGHSEHAFEPGKPYCKDCTLKCERECVACKKPYPNLKAFALNENRCNSCQKKYEHNKKKREMKKLEDDIENDQIKKPEEAAKDMGMENCYTIVLPVLSRFVCITIIIRNSNNTELMFLCM